MSDIRATPGGLSMDVDIDRPSHTPAAQPNTEFLAQVPEGFSDKPWVQDLAKKSNPMLDFFKEYENQRSLIGRKAEGLKVPTGDSTPEEWKAFHTALGVPENVDEYKYEEPTVPENLKEYFKQDESLLKAMREAAQKAGVTPSGFKHLAAAFDSYYLAQLDQTLKAADTNIAELENSFKQKYGDRANQVLEQWGSLSKMAPDWASPVLESLPDPAKVALAAWADQVAAKYIREDQLDTNVPGTGSAMTQADYGDKFAELLTTVRQYPSNTVEHMRAKQELANLRAKGSEIFKVS